MTAIDHRGVVPYSLYESERTEKEAALQTIARYQRRHDRITRLARRYQTLWHDAAGTVRSLKFAFFGVLAIVMLAAVARGR